MFTLQTEQLIAALIDAGLPADAANSVGSVLGNCAQKLEHRGQVKIDAVLPRTASGAALEITGAGNYPLDTVPTSLDGITGPDGLAQRGKADVGGPKALIWNGVALGNGPLILQGPFDARGGVNGVFTAGMCVLWSFATPVPAGWALMNGTDNSVANGGSGINMGGFFVRGATATPSNNPLGDNDHVHEFGTSCTSCITYITGSESGGTVAVWGLSCDTGNYTGVDVVTPGHTTTIPVAYKELYFIEKLS